MRPHRLVIQAMGPFADEVVVELDAVAGEGLFLIHGRTGAGKTSLLDAMCFALYGEVPGARARHGLKSHHADDQTAPRASLEFSVHGQRYRVDRQPRYDVPRKRGDGVTTRQPKATLVRLTSAGQVTLATSTTEVTREVRDLIGLTAAQFQQVVLLPQGQFEKVLRSGSETREDLLKTLFDTLHFEQATSWLEHEAKQRHLAVLEHQRCLGALAEEAANRRVDLSLDATPGTDAESDTESDTEAEAAPGPDAGASVEAAAVALDGWVDEAQVAHHRAELAVNEATTSFAQADAALAEVLSVVERWDRRHAAQAELRELDRAAATVAEARRQLTQATHAEQLRPSLDQVARHRRALAQAHRHLAEALAAAARARARAPQLPAPARQLQLAVTDGEAGPDLAELGQARRALVHERARLADLEEAAAAAAAARTHAHEARGRATEEAGEAARAEERRRAAEAELAVLEPELAGATTARDQLDGLTRRADDAQASADAATQLARLRTSVDTTEQQLLGAREAAVTAAERHLELRRRYLDDIAAALAAALVDGAACLVCGSHEHPAPARHRGDAISLEAVERAEERARLAEKDRQALVDRLAELRESAAALTARAGTHALDPVAAHQVAAEAATARRLASTAADRVEPLTRRRALLDEATAELRRRIADHRASAQRATAQAEALDAQAAAAQARITAAIGSEADLQDVLDGLDQLDDALGVVEEHTRTAGHARLALAQATQRLDADLAAAPFADEDGARSALVDEAARTTLAAQLEAHDACRARAEAALAAPELADLPERRPDVDQARVAVQVAESRRDDALRRLATVANARRRIDELARQHRTGRHRLDALRADAELHETVAARCSGRVAPRISLQRWVLATYLTEICEHANRRLGAMTAGRYQLLVARDGGRANAKAGLDLRVHDAHTGEERDVATLSGGETFQASLALALGVADRVEAHSGGVRLDTLFVDEGFGTLDPEALQLAMDELDGLRAGGRTVGLISHVAALRERIRVGIEVTATERGSTVRTGELSPV